MRLVFLIFFISLTALLLSQTVCSQTNELNPNSDIDYYNRGVIRRESGDRQGAISDFTQVIKIACGNSIPCSTIAASAYDSRGREYERMGNKRKALEDYQKAVEILKQHHDDTYKLILNDIERVKHEIAK